MFINQFNCFHAHIAWKLYRNSCLIALTVSENFYMHFYAKELLSQGKYGKLATYHDTPSTIRMKTE